MCVIVESSVLNEFLLSQDNFLSTCYKVQILLSLLSFLVWLQYKDIYCAKFHSRNKIKLSQLVSNASIFRFLLIAPKIES